MFASMRSLFKEIFMTAATLFWTLEAFFLFVKFIAWPLLFFAIHCQRLFIFGQFARLMRRMRNVTMLRSTLFCVISGKNQITCTQTMYSFIYLWLWLYLYMYMACLDFARFASEINRSFDNSTEINGT